MPAKKYIRKKGNKIMFNRRNCDLKSQLSGILTEPLNPRNTNLMMKVQQLWRSEK